ncbi:MAG: phosphate propanoyltransferase [Synergistaceae bacterium]|jgi:putative phosphotransacetylase|nr:phosphate propanoyltransferase [Synergistaceae bacterium]
MTFTEDAVEKIASEVISRLKMKGENALPGIPVGVSNKHIHLSQEDLEILFGKGYELTRMKDLGQPGQYAAKETLCVAGPKGSFTGTRVLGPVRKESQVEISRTDAYQLGVNPPVRASGDLNGGADVCLIGPAGMLALKSKVIIAKRHLHMTPAEASLFGVSDGDIATLTCDSERKCHFCDTIVRSASASALEFHIDTDEANAAGIRNGMFARIESVKRKLTRS